MRRVAGLGVLALALACSNGLTDGGLTGTLVGRIAVGPFCPVASPDDSCPIPPGTFERMAVVVRRGRIVARVAVVEQGRYRVELAAGSYEVGLEHDLGIDPGAGEPFEPVVIEAGETTTLDFSVDTGIRSPPPTEAGSSSGS